MERIALFGHPVEFFTVCIVVTEFRYHVSVDSAEQNFFLDVYVEWLVAVPSRTFKLNFQELIRMLNQKQ